MPVRGGVWTGGPGRSAGIRRRGFRWVQHTVEFSDVAGWTKPGNRTVTISNGQTTTGSGTYTQPTGSLRVTIDPQGAIDAGAQWRVDGGAWHGSGDDADRAPGGAAHGRVQRCHGLGEAGQSDSNDQYWSDGHHNGDLHDARFLAGDDRSAGGD